MDTTKKCEVCGVDIPEDFQNLLCVPCYEKQSKETGVKKEEELEAVKKNPNSPINNTEGFVPVHGILDPEYKINPQMDDKDQVLANLAQFVYSKKLLWYPTRNMYNAVRDWCRAHIQTHSQYPKYIWKPKIVDVGCGSGVGSNVLSQEADMVWGIDKNQMSILFGKEAFQREKNGIYYSSQLTFDQVDIVTDNREFMQFDVVVAIEIIEHVEDVEAFMKGIIRFTKKDKKGRYVTEHPTQFFISTPNRTSPKIQDKQPKNIYHVREWTHLEFLQLMESYFENVELLTEKGEPLGENIEATPIMARCSVPKI